MLARPNNTPAQPEAPAGAGPATAAAAAADPIWIAEKTERWPTSRLRPDPRNAREHGAEQIEELRAIIRRLGFVRAIMARENGVIIAGEGRWTVAVLEGMPEVPVIPKPPHWSEEDCREYALADNALGLRSTWNNKLLGVEIADLKRLGRPVDGLGFTPADLKRLAPTASSPAAAKVPPLKERYEIVIVCFDEAAQLALLERLQAEGFTCRAMVA